VWRDPETLQIGLDPERALLVTGIETPLAEIVDSLTGLRTEDAVVTRALAKGASRTATRTLLRLLTEGGALDDAEATLPLDLGPAERERLRPDLAASSLAEGTLDGGTGSLDRRRRTTVAVHGAGRVGATVAAMVSATGVREVIVVDRSPVRSADLAPAGAGTADLGVSRAEAACRAAERVAPSTRVGTVGPGELADRPDVAVLAPDYEPDRDLADAFVRAGVPHLVVRMRDGRALLGPFVLPGESSCMRCHDLRRAAGDPGWPEILDDLLAAPGPTPACDVTLATAAASQAVLHVLAHVDGHRPPSVDATLEMSLPFGATRRRSWSPHPACGCQWSPQAQPEPAPD
jgi:bacteriocin biosynthesis cyclodehydratase domain-containing protein